MKHPRPIVVLVLLLAGAFFAVVNQPILSAKAEVNLVFTHLEMAFGVLLLIEAVVLVGAAVLVGSIHRFRARKRIGALEDELRKARRIAMDTCAEAGPPGASEKETLRRLEEVEQTVRKENQEVAERVSDAEKHLSKEIQTESEK